MTPINITLVSSDETNFSNLEKQLSLHKHFSCLTTTNCKLAHIHVLENKTDVVIAAENLYDSTGLDCIQGIVKLNPFINCALSSSLSHDDFHEATEGYGIFMQLSTSPTSEEALELIDKLNKIYQLMGENK